MVKVETRTVWESSLNWGFELSWSNRYKTSDFNVTSDISVFRHIYSLDFRTLQVRCLWRHHNVSCRVISSNKKGLEITSHHWTEIVGIRVSGTIDLISNLSSVSLNPLSIRWHPLPTLYVHEVQSTKFDVSLGTPNTQVHFMLELTGGSEVSRSTWNIMKV